jgi:mRNA-degrading endonuclease RelE of RelBE toxin-antitoxin system
MYQVTFSDQGMKELNRLDKLKQMEIVMPISGVQQKDLASPREPLGRFHRNGKELYRLRAGDYRFYFEVRGEALHILFILHKNSLSDFVMRTKLPVTENLMVEEHPSFWKYLESLTR